MKLLVLSVFSPFNKRKPLSWVSRGIRAVTRFHWHHSAFLYVPEDGPMMIIESDIDGVVMTPFQEWAGEKEITVHGFGTKSLPEYLVLEKILSRVGKSKYDYRGLLFHHVINEFFGIWIGPKKPGKAYQRFTCSEFVCWGLGWPLAYKSTPKDIYLTLPILFHMDKAKELSKSVFYTQPVPGNAPR